ncbi:Branched-chain amino acid aminotransferase [Staphylococcus aureus]|nr:Branched-chain amino acid aminotransferase [Staphylococcus aureus]
MSQAVKVERRETLKQKPNTSQLGFGKYFTDYMLSYDYDADKGWHDLKIVIQEVLDSLV